MHAKFYKDDCNDCMKFTLRTKNAAQKNTVHVVTAYADQHQKTEI